MQRMQKMQGKEICKECKEFKVCKKAKNSRDKKYAIKVNAAKNSKKKNWKFSEECKGSEKC